VGENLRIPRKPLTDPGRNINFLPSEFETRVGARVLPEFFDVTDDATQETYNGKALSGFYLFDLEGVKPKPVSVIEKGTLRNVLTTRQPIKNFPVSNGHARLGGNGGNRSAAFSNLFFKASQSQPMDDLKKQLLQLLKDRSKPYGMLVRKLDFPFSGGGSELQALAQASSQSGGSARPVSPPILVYRVYPDGREELVRGLRFRGNPSLHEPASRAIRAGPDRTPNSLRTGNLTGNLFFSRVEWSLSFDRLTAPAHRPRRSARGRLPIIRHPQSSRQACVAAGGRP